MQKAGEFFLSSFIAVAEEINLETEAARTKHIRIKCHINTGLCSFVFYYFNNKNLLTDAG